MPRARPPVLELFPQFRFASHLEAAVRAEIGPWGYEEEFESSLVADLIERAHYYCAPRGLRPTRFRKERRQGRTGDPSRHYDFYGYFPEIGWHAVSWLKCIKGRTWESDLQAALRREVAGEMAERRRKFPTCERCRTAPSTETDHVEPEFFEMVATAVLHLSEDEIRHAFAGFDWLTNEPFMLPASHPIRTRFLEVHAGAQLQAVCAPCHRQNADERTADRK